ncbi:hypothetical protein JCM8547_005005 [Rhodosporidiobolus lusitaniae]
MPSGRWHGGHHDQFSKKPSSFSPSKYRRGSPLDNDDDDDAVSRAQADDLVKPPGIEPFGPSPPFGVLCSLFEQFENATRNRHKKPGYKGELLKEFVAKWRRNVGPDLYPVIRLLLPERDHRRRTYNLKEAKLAKAIITALGLPPKSDAARKLENWKTPTKDDPGAGEFATVAYEVIKTRSTVTVSRSEVQLDVINETLDKLSHTATTVGPDGQRVPPMVEHSKIIRTCIKTLTPSEMKWLIRIILRDLKIGMGEKSILSAVHADAMEVFNTCSDIKRVCWRLHNPNERVPREDSTVTIGSVFRPMLSWRAKQLKDVVKAMKRNRPNRGPEFVLRPGEYNDDEFIIEEKLDGERIQMHKIGDQYSYHSRKAKDYTYLYGESHTTGSLSPFLQDAFVDGIEELILDGEMLVWDPSLGKYMAFGNLKTFASMKRQHFGPNDARPCFKVFDVLYIKGRTGPGQPLLRQPLWDRKNTLQQIVKEKKGVVELADCATGKSADDIRAYLTRILEERGEGLVVKHPNSTYRLGTREDAWIKIKPEYMDSLGEHIDAIVIGGYWGQGNRGGILASYMVGLRGKANGKDVVFSFAKVGTGFSRSDYQEIHEKYAHYFRPYDKANKPDWFHTVSEWPDVLIDPHDSFVLEVKAAEIVGGAEYGAGMTLRFPRCAKMRDNKTYSEAMDIETIRYLNHGPKKRLLDGELAEKKDKGFRIDTKSKKARSISTAVGNVDKVSKIFENLYFYVHTAKPGLKKELEKKITENGGQFQQSIPPEEVNGVRIDRLVVASEYKGIKSRKGSKDVDIVKSEWVEESIEKGRRMPYYQRLLHQPSPATKETLTYNATEEPDDLPSMLLDLDSDDDEHHKPVHRPPGTTPSKSPPPFTAPHLLQPRPNYGEEVLDSEDEPVTDDEGRRDNGGESAVEADAKPGVEDSDWDVDSLAESQTSLTKEVAGLRIPDVRNADWDEFESQMSKARKGVEEVKLEEKETEEKEGEKQEMEMDETQEQTQPQQEASTMAIEESPVEAESMQEDEEDDPTKPFKRFLAYFDTKENAAENGLPASTASEPIQREADKKLVAAKEAFVNGGGTATDNLFEPKLTHLITTTLVPDRYKEMIRKTAEPAYRRLVTVDWVVESLEEETPLDEDDYKP